MERVGLGSSCNPQSSPLSLERWAWGCSDCTRSPDGQSPTCKWTHPHQRWAQWGWCCPQTSGAWQTDDWRCSCWYKGRRMEGKGRSLGGIQADGLGVMETCFPSFTCCLLSDREFMMHLQVESGTLSGSHRLQTCWLCMWTAGGLWWLRSVTAQGVQMTS